MDDQYFIGLRIQMMIGPSRTKKRLDPWAWVAVKIVFYKPSPDGNEPLKLDAGNRQRFEYPRAAGRNFDRTFGS